MRRLPVVEIFGPTVQGEGVDQGTPVHFVRLGGCDYRCGWCDTPHAVLPAEVRLAERLAPADVVERVEALDGSPAWVIISGGNPVLHDLDELVTRFHDACYSVAVETQASTWKNWLSRCDRLCLSPKGPSSGMTGRGDVDRVIRRVGALADYRPTDWAFLKVVVFDEADYAFARDLHCAHPRFPFFVSAGNDAGRTVGNPERRDTRSTADIRSDLIDTSRWLVERVLDDADMSDVKVQSQYHVLLWGNELGR